MIAKPGRVYDRGPMLQGRYRSTGILGQGGMGTVYRVDDVSTGQRCALECLAKPLAGQRSPPFPPSADVNVTVICERV